MDTVTYPDARVAQFIGQHCVPLRIVVKENRRLAEDHCVSWTPNVVFTDPEGRVEYRVEGYLPPEDFIAHIALGLGRHWLCQKRFDDAKERFHEVTQRHAGTDAGAEALYWLGVASYKATHDVGQLRSSWERLTQDYPESDWAKRSLFGRKDSSSEGTSQPHLATTRQKQDPVEEASEESFPASDPPSWTLGSN